MFNAEVQSSSNTCCCILSTHRDTHGPAIGNGLGTGLGSRMRSACTTSTKTSNGELTDTQQGYVRVLEECIGCLMYGCEELRLIVSVYDHVYF